MCIKHSSLFASYKAVELPLHLRIGSPSKTKHNYYFSLAPPLDGIPGFNTAKKNTCKCLIFHNEETNQGVPVVLLSVLCNKDKRDRRGGEFCWNHDPVVRPVGHAIFSISHIASRHMSNHVAQERKKSTEKSVAGERVGV